MCGVPCVRVCLCMLTVTRTCVFVCTRVYARAGLKRTMEALLNCKRDAAFKEKLKKALVQNSSDYRCALPYDRRAATDARPHTHWASALPKWGIATERAGGSERASERASRRRSVEHVIGVDERLSVGASAKTL